MAEYTPLMSAPPEEDEVESQGPPPQELSPRYVLFFSMLMALMAISAAAAFHLSVLSAAPETQLLLRPRDIESSLRMVQPSPNLQKGHATMRKMKFKFPRMVFPKFIVRANAAQPDTAYESGSSVVLSPTDSMIYYWRSNSSWPKCYLTVGMSWKRLSLLGTVNFTTRETQNWLGYLDGQEIKEPTPRFDCLGDTEITVELVCRSCRLEFDQVFSMPPLALPMVDHRNCEYPCSPDWRRETDLGLGRRAGPLNYEEPYSPDEMERRAGPLNYEEPYSPDEVERRAGPLNYEEPYSPDEMERRAGPFN
ncbi:hypothetical protein DFH06DRAFT_1481296 [Mycena polygramma]|nr:hypothetical protein DFH06DRAFT_1481296 [Mycena polygramma]